MPQVCDVCDDIASGATLVILGCWPLGKCIPSRQSTCCLVAFLCLASAKTESVQRTFGWSVVFLFSRPIYLVLFLHRDINSFQCRHKIQVPMSAKLSADSDLSDKFI
jgi:hypothetical protein